MKFTLPYPPSANRYWRNYRGRTVKSAEAKAYCTEVFYRARQSVTEAHSGPVSVSVDVYRPIKRGDPDNRLKIVLDALQNVAYEDDKQIVEIHARRHDDKENPRVEVEVTEV